MITPDKVKAHIAAIENEMKVPGIKLSSRVKMAGFLNDLRSVISLLDLTPGESFFDNQHAKIKDKLSSYKEAKRNVPHDYYRKSKLVDLEK
jgi:hypothetical protein